MKLTRPFPRTLAALALAGAIGVATVPALAVQDSQPQLPGQMDVSRVTAGTYQTDPAHTLVGWRVNHFGFNDYFGSFGDAEGTLTMDPADPSAAKVDVTVPITSVSVWWLIPCSGDWCGARRAGRRPVARMPGRG